MHCPDQRDLLWTFLDNNNMPVADKYSRPRQLRVSRKKQILICKK